MAHQLWHAPGMGLGIKWGFGEDLMTQRIARTAKVPIITLPRCSRFALLLKTARQSVFVGKNNQTFGDGESGQTRDVVDIQLAHHVLTVRFHGANTDPESAGDFFIAKTSGEVCQNFPLAVGELRGAGSFTGAMDELVKGRARDIRAEKGFAGIDRFDSAHQFLQGGFFEDIAARAGLDDAQDIIGVAVHREDEDFDAGKFTTQAFGDRQAVHEGHFDVHEDDVGQKLLGFAKGFEAIGGFADDGEAFLPGEAGADAAPDKRVVIDQQQFNTTFHQLLKSLPDA